MNSDKIKTLLEKAKLKTNNISNNSLSKASSQQCLTEIK